MEKQGLAMPMDVRCQYDVNEQIYRALSTLGIDEVLYPLPKQSPFLELCTMPIHRFLREKKAQDPYREKIASVKKDALKLQERRRIITQRNTLGPLDAGCRQPKRDVGPRKGPVSIRKQTITPQPRRDTGSRLSTFPEEWNDYCAVPGSVVCKNCDRSVYEHHKEAEDHTGGNNKTISLADNYDISDNLGSCLAPSCEVDNKIDTFLSRQDLVMPIQVLPEPLRLKPVSNPRYTLHDEKSCYDPKGKGRTSPGDFVAETNDKKSKKAYTDAKGCQRHEGHLSIKEQHRERLPQSNSTDHDGLSIDDNTLQIEKSCLETKENKAIDSKFDQIKKRKSKPHSERKKDQSAPVIADSTSKQDTNPELGLVKVKNVLEEHSSAFESRSADELCEASPGRRVSCASDLERDMRGSHSRTSGSRQFRDKQKENRSNRKQTPVVMYSESECSLLCQKYNN